MSASRIANFDILNVADTSAWLEFLTDGGNSGVFGEPIASRDRLIVPTISIYEVFKISFKRFGKPFASRAVALMAQERVIDLDTEIAIAAAQISARHRLPMADSVILATARRYDATLWTQDADFAGIDGVRYIPKAA